MTPTPGPPKRVPDPPYRGYVYFIDLGGDLGRKPYVVISNNARNQHLDTVLGVRITTTPQTKDYATRVPLAKEDEPIVGTVLCDDIAVFYRDEFASFAGALTLMTMQRIDAALRIALCL